MISINLLDGKIVAGDSNAPIPNRLARTVTQSGNYGLADHARQMFRSMSVNPQDKKQDEVEELARYAGRGRGRGGRGIRPFDPLPLPEPPSYASSECCLDPEAGMEQRSRATSESTIGHEYASSGSRRPPELQKYVTQCLFQDGEEVRVKGLVNANAKKGAPRVNAVAKPSKPNGYVMYLQHMRKKTGVTESATDQLIKMFDKDWKALSEDERKEWKEKAKVLRPAPSSSAAASCQLGSSVTKRPPPPKFMGDANRANAIARGLSAAGLIADDEVDDDGDEWS